jgi:PBP1b-binding outer membrane lipoprotein LpoB
MIMVRVPAFAVLALLLAGCSLTDALQEQLKPTPAVKVEAKGEHSIVLGPVESESDTAAATLAQKHCAEQGQVARLPRLVGLTSVHYLCMP